MECPGRKWKKIREIPPNARRQRNQRLEKKLEEHLRENSSEEFVEFEEKDWFEFGITRLESDHYVQTTESKTCFQPAKQSYYGTTFKSIIDSTPEWLKTMEVKVDQDKTEDQKVLYKELAVVMCGWQHMDVGLHIALGAIKQTAKQADAEVQFELDPNSQANTAGGSKGEPSSTGDPPDPPDLKQEKEQFMKDAKPARNIGIEPFNNIEHRKKLIESCSHQALLKHAPNIAQRFLELNEPDVDFAVRLLEHYQRLIAEKGMEMREQREASVDDWRSGLDREQRAEIVGDGDELSDTELARLQEELRAQRESSSALELELERKTNGALRAQENFMAELRRVKTELEAVEKQKHELQVQAQFTRHEGKTSKRTEMNAELRAVLDGAITHVLEDQSKVNHDAGGWSVVGMLSNDDGNTATVIDAVVEGLMKPLKDKVGGAEVSEGLARRYIEQLHNDANRQLGDQGGRTLVVALLLDSPLVDVISDKVENATVQLTANKDDVQGRTDWAKAESSKFVVTGGGTNAPEALYGSVGAFFSGLEGLIGPPTDLDDPVVTLEAVKKEHTAMDDSHVHFTSGNYEIHTTSESKRRASD